MTGLALRAAAARPHVLPATLPGGTAARLAAERVLRLRDWPLAATPAQADVLLVAGPARPDLDAAVDRLWQDMPAPRARVQALSADDVEAALATGQARLGSPAGRRTQAEAPDAAESDDEGDHSRSHGGHEGHGGHGGGEMEMPGGLPMAEQGEDRDGLTLDQLHVALGPLLADWPSGLAIRVTLQGDVVQEAEVEEPLRPGSAVAEAFWVQPWLRAAAGEPVSVGEAVRRRAAAHLDSLARLLSVAGWPAEAVVARRLRDDLLDGAPGAAVVLRLERFARRVGRSRTLAWMTRGIGQVSAERAREAGVSGPAARAGGDVSDRYRQWLAVIRRDVGRLEEPSPLRPAVEESPRGWWRDGGPPSAALIRLLPGLLTGAELAAARLIVASLDPDLDELAAARREVTAS
ncbi:hypothetical protein [Streptomyces sp. NRRL F-5126]|uniref:hypothetical protein n=1 Tax=Streptomyces sp. NRRL F-5126 TaxID=1463857 RepID=UPI002D21D61C|nr:hypothetical protein [Streptomyces sp. NRRL F-5126]